MSSFKNESKYNKLSNIIFNNAVWVIQTVVRKKRAIMKINLEKWEEVASSKMICQYRKSSCRLLGLRLTVLMAFYQEEKSHKHVDDNKWMW